MDFHIIIFLIFIVMSFLQTCPIMSLYNQYVCLMVLYYLSQMANAEGVQNKAKREIFIWKPIHEELLLREVLVLEPYQHRQGSKEKGAAWSKIAENLVELGMKASQRSVREKFEKLLNDFKRKEAMEQQTSGDDVEYTERDRAMMDILERINECEMAWENKKEKENLEKATAEEMRKKATERFGETRRRHSEENQENEELVTPERKRRRNSDIIEVLKGSLEIKKKEQEQAGQLRERELALMENRLQRQEDFQRTLIEQQHQFQQQQQALTMSILNTLAKITQSLKK